MRSEIQEFEDHNTVTVSRHIGQVPRNPFETIQAESDYDRDHDDFPDETNGTPDIRNVPFPVDASNSFPIHEQSGHSNATANRHYGISASDLNGFGLINIQKFRMTSKAWHNLLRPSAEVSHCITPERVQSSSSDPRKGKTLAEKVRPRTCSKSVSKLNTQT